MAVDNIICNWVDLKHAFHQGKLALYVILLTRFSNFKADNKIDSNDTDSNVHFEQVRITLSSTSCKCIYTTFNQLCLLTSRSQTCNCKNGTDWLKRWVEAQHNIYVEKCFVIDQ